jgi:hypothetical protein
VEGKAATQSFECKCELLFLYKMTFFQTNQRDFVKHAMNMQRSIMSSENDTNSITEISPNTPIKYNSVNVALGRCGFGKTHTFIQEFVRIGRDSERTHMLIYITKKNVVDRTFSAQRELIDLPIEIVPGEVAEQYIRELIRYKTIYESVADGSETLSEEEVEVLLDSLKVYDFSVRGLHTLVFIDDSNNSPLLQKKSYITALFSETRHVRMSFFICVQIWRALMPDIKKNVATIILFGTYSPQELSYVLQQIPLERGKPEFMRLYRSLRRSPDGIGADYMVIDTETGDISIERYDQ